MGKEGRKTVLDKEGNETDYKSCIVKRDWDYITTIECLSRNLNVSVFVQVLEMTDSRPCHVEAQKTPPSGKGGFRSIWGERVKKQGDGRKTR